MEQQQPEKKEVFAQKTAKQLFESWEKVTNETTFKQEITSTTTILKNLSPEKLLEVLKIENKKKKTALHLIWKKTTKETFEKAVEATKSILEMINDKADIFELLKIQNNGKNTVLQLIWKNTTKETFVQAIEITTKILNMINEQKCFELLVIRDKFNRATVLNLIWEKAFEQTPILALEQVMEVIEKILSRVSSELLVNKSDGLDWGLNSIWGNVTKETFKQSVESTTTILKMVNEQQRLELLKLKNDNSGLDTTVLHSIWRLTSTTIKIITFKEAFEATTTILNMINEQQVSNKISCFELFKIHNIHNNNTLYLIWNHATAEVFEESIKITIQILNMVNEQQRLELLELKDDFSNNTVLPLICEKLPPKKAVEAIQTILNLIKKEKHSKLLKIQNLGKKTVLHLIWDNAKKETFEEAVEATKDILNMIEEQQRSELLKMKDSYYNTVLLLIWDKVFKKKLTREQATEATKTILWKLNDKSTKLEVLKIENIVYATVLDLICDEYKESETEILELFDVNEESEKEKENNIIDNEQNIQQNNIINNLIVKKNLEQMNCIDNLKKKLIIQKIKCKIISSRIKKILKK